MLRVEYALTSDRTMKALTGLTRPAFRALIPVFNKPSMKRHFTAPSRASASPVEAVRLG